jgi:hypothetical protein
VADFGALIGGIGQSGLIGRAIVGLDLDTKKYQTELKAAEAQTQAGTQSIGQKFGALSGLAKAAFLGVGVAAVAGIAIAIKAGSDLNEQLNKSKVVFGEASKSVIAFADDAATSFGIAKSEALEAAGNFGQLFQAAGFVDKAAASMSVKMVQLSADLGSFNNIPVAEALEKIRSGLAGEAEPLRQLGVFLSEAAVETEAYASGIAKVGTDLTDAQKIQARYNIILDSTTKAQGDFGRTVGESLPNQLKVLKAELTNTAAELGTTLLPIVLEVVKAFKIVVPLLKLAADHLGLIIAALAGFAAFKYIPAMLIGIGQGLETIIGTTAAVKLIGIAEGIQAVGVALAGAGPPALAFGLAFGGATAALAAWDPLNLVGDTEKLRESMEVTTQTFGESDIVLGRVAVSQNLLQHATQEATVSIEEMRQKAGLAAEGVLNLGGATAKTKEHVKDLQERVKNFAHMTTKDFKEWAVDIKASFDTFVLSLEESEDAQADTRRGFRAATTDMLQDARDLAHAMRDIAKEKWVNDNYIKFLSEQGPEWLIGFTKLTEEQQRKAQQAWQESTTKTDKAKESLDRITGVLNDLDKKDTKHKVTIEYDYVGFDPTKPGMSAGQTGGGTRGQT